MPQKEIRDIMRRGVVTCGVDATVADAAETMVNEDVSVVVVVDERLDACGVITRTDLIKHYGEDLTSITAEDIMTPRLWSASPETKVHDAIRQMLARNVHQLVVVTEGGTHRRPVGIFTRSDALAALMAGEPSATAT